MNLSQIRTMPTGVGPFTKEQCEGVHESCLRSYQMLEKVKEWLKEEVPHKVILELISDTMDAPDWDKDSFGDLGTLMLNKPRHELHGGGGDS